MTNLSETIKENVARTTGKVITELTAGRAICSVLLFSEPEMPMELIMEDAE